MRILQISDTHISAEHADFSTNVEAIGEVVRARNPDLIINTGDLAMNGCISPVDLELAHNWQQSLGAPIFSVPGNHDVGDRPEIRADQALDSVRLDRFRQIAGSDRWTFDFPGWRLIGLNAMVFATGHQDEDAQFAWLEAAVSTDAKVAVFMHKPLFIDEPDEGPRGYWTVTPEPRRKLLQILGKCDLRLVASGHLHIARELRHGNVTHIWGPAASFVCGEIQEDLGGERRIGFIDYTFDESGFSHAFVFPENTPALPLDPVLDRIYGHQPDDIQ